MTVGVALHAWSIVQGADEWREGGCFGVFQAGKEHWDDTAVLCVRARQYLVRALLKCIKVTI